MFEPKPCATCNSTCQFVSTCPRLGMGYYVCPKCDEALYLINFPPVAYRRVQDRLKHKLQEAKNAIREFEEEYRKDPKLTLQKHY